MDKVFDVIIIGGGPGGYTAALYAARAGLKALVLEGVAAGGQLGQTHWIDNYPGFPDGIDGFSLAQQFQAQAHRFGAQTCYEQVCSVDLKAVPKTVTTGKSAYLGKTVILAPAQSPALWGCRKKKNLLARVWAIAQLATACFIRAEPWQW